MTDNAEFKTLLRRAGREDPAMRQIKDPFFDKRYVRPALRWGDENGSALQLLALVIYDSFVQSRQIIWSIRMMFSESPPVKAGNEQSWIKSYIGARHRWLKSHSRRILHSTIYRTECFKREIARKNWDLTKTPINAHGLGDTP